MAIQRQHTHTEMLWSKANQNNAVELIQDQKPWKRTEWRLHTSQLLGQIPTV